MFRTGYILSPRSDLLWFLLLPFLAIAFALGVQQWLPAVALPAIGLWITFPHHCATWLRTFGLKEDLTHFKERLIVGPVVIMGMALLGLRFAPLTLAAIIALWDHQHSVMQQHGFARIYDFKANTGSPSARTWDLWLNWTLYLNVFLTSPLFSQFWIRELYRFGFSISAEAVRMVHYVSWGVLILFLCVYAGYLVWTVLNGYTLNPIKYCFLGASYFLWYFVSWHSASVMVYGVAHRIMHGVQYIVIVYWYLRRKAESKSGFSGSLATVFSAGNVGGFLLLLLGYSVVYNMISGQPMDYFGFGVITFMKPYSAIPAHGVDALSYETGYELFSLLLINSIGTIHYYFDSFIWKIRDTKVQKGL